MARKSYNFRLPEELIAKVDEARGDVSRTKFLERALEIKVLAHRRFSGAEKASEELGRASPTDEAVVAADPPQEPSERPKRATTEIPEAMKDGPLLYHCPRHPDVQRLSPAAPCPKCGRKTSEPVD